MNDEWISMFFFFSFCKLSDSGNPINLPSRRKGAKVLSQSHRSLRSHHLNLLHESFEHFLLLPTMMRRDDEGQQEEAILQPPPPPAVRPSIIVSGESEEGETDELYQFDPSNPSNADGLYDSNLDEEDAAYVYRHMRSGIKETITVAQGETGEKKTKNISVYKPRYSDAQLQCPCCFQIVCMDCQRHERYLNQYRAMFVMGIVVDWNSKLIYDESQQALVAKPENPESLSSPEELTNHHVNGEYFAVLCASCRTQVAALDMEEEVYHFHGCLGSS
jgi:hypothetical protein